MNPSEAVDAGFLSRLEELRRVSASRGGDVISLDDDGFTAHGTDANRVKGEARPGRRLWDAAAALKGVVRDEIRAEVARDSVDGAAAIPPLPPPGWAVHHSPGTGYFSLTATLPSGDAPHSPDNGQRYRSIYEEHLRRLGPHNPSRQSSSSDLSCHTSSDPSCHTSSSAPLLQGKVPRWGGRAPYEGGRSSTQLTLFAPFRVQDLSLYDPTVSIGEWATFDVLVRKTPLGGGRTPALGGSSKKHREASLGTDPNVNHAEGTTLRDRKQGMHPCRRSLMSQQRVWDEREGMWVRLAFVNSELRIRGVQFLSARLARALEEFAVFGHGDPFFIELLRQFNALQIRREDFPRGKGTLRSSGRRQNMGEAGVGEYDAPIDRFRQRQQELSGSNEGTANTSYLSSPFSLLASPGERLLTECWNYTGDVARTLAYGGPYLTELSKELNDALLTYIMVNLQINHQLAEYVCQMQFFLEQEEYMGWLARWQVMAETLQRAPCNRPR
ncbi:unnamed protein product, partial [Phytomonas sp. Hart1]